MFCASAGREPWIDRLSHRFFAVSFEAAFRRLVEAHRGRNAGGGEDVSDRRFGPGGSIPLGTADEVLQSMGEPPFGPLFEAEIEAYLAVTGTKAYVLGQLAINDASFVTRLRAGSSPYLGTVDRVRAWMGEHSTAPERRAIAAATLHTSWWRLGVGGPVREEDGRSSHDGPRERRPRYLTPGEAAKWLNVGKRTLQRLRAAGEGPPYHVFGQQIRYAEADLEAWAQGRRKEPGGGA